MKPQEYPRRVLLALTGLSPQVVTETVYALATQEDPFIPTEIHLFTTLEGVQRARLLLLHESTGWFQRLVEELELPDITFTEGQIHVPRDEQGNIVKDMRSLVENEQTADALSSLVSKFTSDPECAVHVSISGGRKTMGFYAGYALSLYGREQDRLSHVLVSEDFEGHTEFFFPTQDSSVIYLKNQDNKPIDTKDAVVTLSEIPFVRMRAGLPERLLAGRVSFSETIRAAQKAEEEPRLVLRITDQIVEAGGETIKHSSVAFAFYYWLAKRRKDGLEPIRWSDPDIADDFLGHFRETVNEMDASLQGAEEALVNGMDEIYFDPRKSHANRKFREALGVHLSKHYLITGTGDRGQTRYGLIGLLPDQIEILP